MPSLTSLNWTFLLSLQRADCPRALRERDGSRGGVSVRLRPAALLQRRCLQPDRLQHLLQVRHTTTKPVVGLESKLSDLSLICEEFPHISALLSPLQPSVCGTDALVLIPRMRPSVCKSTSLHTLHTFLPCNTMTHTHLSLSAWFSLCVGSASSTARGSCRAAAVRSLQPAVCFCWTVTPSSVFGGHAVAKQNQHPPTSEWAPHRRRWKHLIYTLKPKAVDLRVFPSDGKKQFLDLESSCKIQFKLESRQSKQWKSWGILGGLLWIQFSYFVVSLRGFQN